MKIQISELSNNGDVRGFSFTAPPAALNFLGRIADMHLASTLPGAVRGNHYHLRKARSHCHPARPRLVAALGRR